AMVDCELCKICLPIVAFVVAYYFVLPLLGIFFRHLVLTKLWSQRRQLKKLGGWAVVTGSTDGIGRAYARLLAKDGLNIVLISRSQEKLDDVAKELRDKYSVQVRIIVADFSQVDVYDRIERELSGIDVACLVNNVGVGYSWPTYLAGGPKPLDAGELQPMLNVNCSSVARMTRMLLPRMLPRGGAVINVASGSGLQPTPFLSAYSASKAYVVNFSESVAAEVRHLASKGGAVKSVTVQTVTPFFVATKLSKIRRASFFAPSPDAFVSEALNLLGVEQLSLGCLSHSLQYLFMSLLPSCVSNYVLCSTMYSTMQRSLKKQGKNN
ncbi:hypothetical protein BOX15_Mlig015389g2, partial [Macrostomum lignano]